ncbi:MAG: hypothetical protein IT448_08820 [Phycisphaerales bacterium]|nr:hypothetical protein [Phycisphaerales bacterium]
MTKNYWVSRAIAGLFVFALMIVSTKADEVPNGDFGQGLSGWATEGQITWSTDSHKVVQMMPDDRVVPHYVSSWNRGLWADLSKLRWDKKQAGQQLESLPVGRLISPSFTIDKKYVQFFVSGMTKQKGNTIGLDFDQDNVVDLAMTPVESSPQWRVVCIDVSAHQGQQARFIIDSQTQVAPGGFSPALYLAVGQIHQTDAPAPVVVAKSGAVKAMSGKITLDLQGSSAADTPYQLEYQIVDKFTRQVAAGEHKGVLAGGKRQKVDIDFPAGDRDYYRGTLRLKDGQGRLLAIETVHVAAVASVGTRKLISLSDGWESAIGDAAQTAPPADAQWQAMKGAGFKQDLPRGGASAVWFSKTLPADRAFDNQSVKIYLDNPFAQLATIFVNGRPVASMPDPNLLNAPGVDVTRQLKPGQPNTLWIRVDSADPYLMEGDRTLWPGVGRQGPQQVRFSGAHLQITGDVYIEDVFAITSVSQKKITIRTTIVNSSSKPRTFTLKHTVNDPGLAAEASEVALGFETLTGVLAPHEQQTVMVEAPWIDARLWDYQSPYLYRLHSQLQTADDQLSDACDTVLAFREFGITQGRITLNGRPVRMRTLFRDTAGPDGLSNPANIRSMKRMGYNMVRNLQPFDSIIAAQDGLLFYVDYPLAFKSGAITQPVFWQRYKQVCQNIARQIRTEPAFVFHSVANELIHSGEGVIYPDLTKRFKEMADAVHEVDPTRIALFNGDLDAGGYSDTINYHYVHDLDEALPWPNGVMWLRPGVEIPAYNQALRWEGYKPILATECFVNGTIESVTHLIGEQAYLPGEGSNELINFQLLHIQGIEAGGVSQFQAWRRGEKIPWLQIVAIDETSHGYSAGSFNRDFVLLNSLLNDVTGSLHWSLTRKTDGQIAFAKDQPMTLPAGVSFQQSINLQLPQVDQPTDYLLKITFRGETDWELADSQAELVRDFTVYPADRSVVQVPTVVFDPAGALAEWISKQPNIRVVKNPQELGELSTGTVLVLAPGVHSLPAAMAEQLQKFMAGGGWVLSLEQESPPDWSPIEIKLTPRANTKAFIIGQGSNLTDGVRQQDLSFWQPDNWVAQRGMEYLQSGAARTLIASGSSGGLDQALLMEMKWGRGGALFNQLLIGSRLDTEPVAAQLLTRWINALGVRRPSTLNFGILASASLTRLLEQMGVEGVDLADVARPATLQGLDIVLLDAQSAQVPTTEMREFVSRGGTLWLHNLDQSTLKQWTDLLPPAIDPGNNNIYQAFRTADGPAGISLADLYGKTNGFVVSDHPVVVGSDPSALQNLALLIDPGILLEYKLGQGRVLIDQLRWHDVDGANSAQARRLLSTMLAWLDIPTKPAKLADAFTFTPIELTGNRGLKLDGTTRGWLGEGSTDLSELPPGRQVFLSTPFIVGDSDTAAAMAIKSGAYGLPQDVTIAQPDQKADELSFLITSAYGFIDFDYRKFIAELVIQYDGNIHEVIPVLYGDAIGDWTYRAPEQLKLSRVAWQGTSVEGATPKIYLMRYRNPYPDRTIKSIHLKGMDDKIVPIVLGITLLNANDQASGSLLAKNRRDQGAFSTVVRSASDQIPPAITDGGSLWWVIGPWDNPNGREGGFSIPFGPEQMIDFNRSYVGLNGASVRWQFMVAHRPDNQLWLDELWPTLDDVVGYGFTYVYSPQDIDALMILGSDDDARVWMNGQLVHEYFGSRSYKPTDRINVHLKKGWNTLLIKCVDRLWGWRFQLWFEDGHGARLEGIHLDALKRQPQEEQTTSQ